MGTIVEIITSILYLVFGISLLGVVCWIPTVVIYGTLKRLLGKDKEYDAGYITIIELNWIFFLSAIISVVTVLILLDIFYIGDKVDWSKFVFWL